MWRRLQEAMKHLRKAAEAVTSPAHSARQGGGSDAGGVVEVRLSSQLFFMLALVGLCGCFCLNG
jgi:hypothetical protein